MQAKSGLISPRLRIKLLQYFNYFGMGAGIPFLGLYYKSVLVYPDGQTANFLIGLAMFIQTILALVANPFAGYLADKFKIENRLLSIFAFLTAAGAFLIALPGFSMFAPWDLQSRYILIIAGAILLGMFSRPIIPLIDSETLLVLHRLDGHALNYSRYRVFGSLGWAAAGSIMGLVLVFYADLKIAAFGYGLGFILLGLVSFSGFKAEIKPVTIPWDYLKKDREFIHFIVFGFLMAFGILGSYFFTSYYLDAQGLDFLVIGIALGASTSLPEVPVMLSGKKLLGLFKNRNLIILGVFLHAVKLGLYYVISLLGSLWLILIVQILHGLGMALFVVGYINFIDQRAHKDLVATYQNLFGIGMNLGVAFGSLFSSLVIASLDLFVLSNGFITLLAAVYLYLTVGRGKSGRDG